MYVRDYRPQPVPKPSREIPKVKYEVKQDIPLDIGEPPPGRYQYQDGMYSTPNDSGEEFVNWGSVNNGRQYVAFHPPRSRAPRKPGYADSDFIQGLNDVNS
jgi:hypothetical protein